MTGSNDDERFAKSRRNMHSKLLKKSARIYYEQKLKIKNREFSGLKELTETDNKTPTTIISNGKATNKPAEIAEVMSNFFVEKVESIRNSINADTFEAISTYKSIIPRVEDTLSLKRKSVEEVYV